MTASGSPVAHSPLVKPAGLLASGYIHITLGDITEWVFVSASHAPDDGVATVLADLENHFRAPEVQALLARLVVTFKEFFAMTPAEWEADLRHACEPATVLQLWNTVADVFDYYTQGKKLPRGARADYLRLILRYFNHPGNCLDGVTFNVLTAGRASRVAAEIGRFFQRRPASGRSKGQRTPIPL